MLSLTRQDRELGRFYCKLSFRDVEIARLTSVTLTDPRIPLASRLCRKSLHGSTGSPRTDGDTLKFKDLAVRPEALEGRTANCEQSSQGAGMGA
jgi:hypothetical protein